MNTRELLGTGEPEEYGAVNPMVNENAIDGHSKPAAVPQPDPAYYPLLGLTIFKRHTDAKIGGGANRKGKREGRVVPAFHINNRIPDHNLGHGAGAEGVRDY